MSQSSLACKRHPMKRSLKGEKGREKEEKKMPVKL